MAFSDAGRCFLGAPLRRHCPGLNPVENPQEISPSSVRTIPVPSASVCHLAADLIGRADELRDKFAPRLKINLPRRAFLNNDPGAHHRNDIGHRQCFDLIMGNIQSRDAQTPLQFAKLHAHALAQLGIEIA